MALISSVTIIRGLSLFHLILAYFFLTAPRILSEQNIVLLLGKSMHLPLVSKEFEKPSAVTGFLAVVLAFLGVSDFAATNLIDEVALHYWTAQAPVRVLFLFLTTGYTYFCKPGGILAAKGSAYKTGHGDYVKNNMVFTWSFVELSLWYWVYTALRNERGEMVARRAEKQKAAEDHM